jgi:chemotaxis protein methyltransferase CheR
MAAEVDKCRHAGRLGRGQAVTESELTEGEFQQFRDLIYHVSGIRVPPTKRLLLSSRIRRRVRACKCSGFADYLNLLGAGRTDTEFREFLDVITTNETFFFRTEHHFDWFRSEFLPEQSLLARQGRRPQELRVWSAACSTGEEPYSLAICLAENSLRLRDWKLHVLGTDLSASALAAAEKGVYGARAMEAVNEKQRRRYFTDTDHGEQWHIRPAIRELVTFQQHNLMQPLAGSPFDCIFIRNVLIYFDTTSKQTVMQHLIHKLAPGGFLVVGPAEGVYDLTGDLKKHSTFLYQKQHS